MMRIGIPLCLILAVDLCSGTPVPTYGTYFGSNDAALAVCVDQLGNVVVAGSTTSQTLPGTTNAFQPTKATGFPNNTNVFVAKFDPTGTTLLWTTFLGGDSADIPTAITVDPSGSVYVIGTTNSSTFPTTSGAYLTGLAQSYPTGFAAKVSADGSALLYSTYLPGTPTALTVSSVAEAYIVGSFLPSVITTGAIGESSKSDITAEDQGVYLLRLNSAGTGLIFGAYLGGGGFNGTHTSSVAIDQQGDAYVAGTTTENAENVITTANGFQGQLPTGTSFVNAAQAGFVVELNPAGSQSLYGTYFGPPYSNTQITNLTVATDGSVYFSGPISTTAAWATPGAYLSAPSRGFVAKLTPGRTTLDAFSFIDNNGTMFSAGIGNQPQRLYIGFSLGAGPGKIIELNVPTLSLASSY